MITLGRQPRYTIGAEGRASATVPGTEHGTTRLLPWIAATLLAFQVTMSTAEGAVGDRSVLPDWAFEARWYAINVRCYHASPAARELGVAGDLAGLRSKLAHIASLGFNTVYLTNVFEITPDLVHSDEMLNVHADVHVAGTELPEHEGALTAFGPAERHLLSVIAEAHRLGLRVVPRTAALSILPRESLKSHDASGLIAASLPYFDPNGDGDPRDGVDGWSWVASGMLPAKFWREWRDAVKRLNPDALLIGDCADSNATEPEACKETFDTAIDETSSGNARRLLVDRDANYTLSAFWRDVTRVEPPIGELSRVAAPVHSARLSVGDGPVAERSSEPAKDVRGVKPPIDSGNDPDRTKQLRLRLALALLYLVDRPPMMAYGQEFGEFGGPDALGCRSVPWPDEVQPAQGRSERTASGPEFLRLVRLLNTQRSERPELSRGALRVVEAALPENVLAFVRSHGATETIVVMNFGDRTERVSLPVGLPQKMIGILTPQLAAPARRPPRPARAALGDHLLVTGARQVTDAWGDLDLVVEPLSVRLILAK